MRLDTLGTLVSIAGIVFFSVTLIIIVLGRKVGDGSQPQRIKVGKYVDLETNSVLTLALITMLPTLGPLALNYWKPDLKGYVPADEISKSYLALKDLSVIIYGSVLVEGGAFANHVDISVIRSGSSHADTTLSQTDEQGQFYIELERPKPKEHYAITWSKSGYASKTLRFGFNEIPFPLVLSKAVER